MDPEPKDRSLVKPLVVAAGGGALLTTATAAVALRGRYAAILAIGVILLVAVGLVIFFALRALRKTRLRTLFQSMLGGVWEAAARGKDPATVARIGLLQRKFEAGIKRYKETGKDIYDLPWYVIIGPPGSGKTCALRNARISGLEVVGGADVDESAWASAQTGGAGGTAGMDWWFGDEAVILDTAGNLVFPEERALESPEWRELLKLLKRQRRECPINGLFIAVDAQKLLFDDPSLDEYADRLRQQIELLQKSLDLRFPVFFLITKSDVVPGFREFADELAQSGRGDLDQQLMGWSNPRRLMDGADEPFRASEVADYLRSVAASLRRRRLRMVKAKAGKTPDFAAGSDALRDFQAGVGALFALPEEVETNLGPRLQQWMEKVFKSKTWSVRPVYVRGIYFTSAMREGGVLDSAKASMLGIPLKALVERQRVRNQKKSFFLRDVFEKKAFLERGLVTPLTDARKYVSNKKRVLIGSAIGATLVWAGLLLWGYLQFSESILRETEAWSIIQRNAEWQTDPPRPIVTTGNGTATYHGDEPLAGGLSLAGFHRDLAARTRENLRLGALGMLYRPLGLLRGSSENFESLRRQAQTNIFQRSVLGPIVQEARQRMLTEASRSRSSGPDGGTPQPRLDRHNRAFLALTRLETLPPRSGLDAASLERDGREILGGLFGYLMGTNDLPPVLLAAFRDTFAKPVGIWPGDELKAGATLEANVYLRAGLTNFNLLTSVIQSRLRDRLKTLTNACGRAESYYTVTEAEILRTFGDEEATYADAVDALPRLREAAAKLDEALQPISVPEGAGADAFLLTAFTNLLAENSAFVSGVRQDFANRLAPPGTATNALVAEIVRSIAAQQDPVGDEIRSVVAAWSRLGRLGRLDTNVTAWVRGADEAQLLRAYQYRLQVLDQVVALTNNVDTARQLQRNSDWLRVREQWSQKWDKLSAEFPDLGRRGTTDWKRGLGGLSNAVWAAYLGNVARTCASEAVSEVTGSVPVKQDLDRPGELVEAVTRLDFLRQRWQAFATAFGTDSPRLREAGLQVKRVNDALVDRRRQIVDSVSAAFDRKIQSMSRFPIGSRTREGDGGEPLDRETVETSYRTYTEIRRRLTDPSTDMSKALASLGSDVVQGLTNRLAGLDSSFNLLFDAQGELRQARIELREINAATDGNAAREDAGYFNRVQIFADKKPVSPGELDSASPQASLRRSQVFSIDRAVTFKVLYLSRAKGAYAEAIVQNLSAEPWSVIRWIRGLAGDRIPRNRSWEIPLVLRDGETPAREGTLHLIVALDPPSN